MQRLTKYSLLLKAVHKNTENEEQRNELTIMVRITVLLLILFLQEDVFFSGVFRSIFKIFFVILNLLQWS